MNESIALVDAIGSAGSFLVAAFALFHARRANRQSAAARVEINELKSFIAIAMFNGGGGGGGGTFGGAGGGGGGGAGAAGGKGGNVVNTHDR